MTAEDIFYLRTKKDGDDYLEIAEQDVRAYLRYLDTESVEQFASTIANIAVLYFQRDQALRTMAQAEITTGVKSESFTEGKVSVKQDYLSSAEMSDQFDEKVQKCLDGLKRFRRAHVPYEEQTDADAE